jgi:predicted small lipoprotein YifL
MLARLKSLCGQYSRLLLLLLVFSGLAITLTGCGKGPLSLLTGGGPNVAANVQAGKENSQAVVSQTTRNEAGRDVNTAQVQADEVKEVTIQEVPPWVVLLLILGWLLPSPNEIGRWITSLFTRKKRNG